MLRRWGVLAVAAGMLAAACSDEPGDVEAFCAAATDTDRFEAVFDDLDPNDVDDAVTTFTAARDAQRELRTDAPGEVRADIDVSISFLDDLIDGLEGADPASDRPAIYAELRPRFDEVEAAGDRIERWIDANC